MLAPTTGPRPGRLPIMLAASVALHAVFALLVVFDVAGIGGGFGFGVGPGYGTTSPRTRSSRSCSSPRRRRR